MTPTVTPPRIASASMHMSMSAAGVEVQAWSGSPPSVSIKWDRGTNRITFSGTPTELEALGHLIVDAARQLRPEVDG